jgi:hypothetical protein
MKLIHFQKAWRLAALFAATFAAIFAASGLRAAEPEPAGQAGRFLLIFETSPGLKKNLPLVRQELGALFVSNLQGEIKVGDDLAVWTVDKELHAGTYPLASWSSEDAEMDCSRLDDFLGNQKYTRHASLAALQPALNHVVKTSERLTVLIFCDSQSPLIGTPYDSGVNDIVTNAAARIKGPVPPFLLVLRSYHGEYLGCSVNRSGFLNFPKFPPPPKPEPVVNPAPVPAPAPAPLTGPTVTPVPALIIVGTHASTNVADLYKAGASPATSEPAVTSPAAPPSATVATPPLSAPPNVAPPVAVTSPANPEPPPNPPAPVPPITPVVPPPAPAVPATTAPQTAVVAPPATAAPARPQVAPASPAAGENTSTDTGTWLPLILGGGLAVAAVLLVIALVFRGRRPQGSLITSSMRDDPRLPPRK